MAFFGSSSSSSRQHTTNDSLAPVYASFLAGIVSASVAWYCCSVAVGGAAAAGGGTRNGAASRNGLRRVLPGADDKEYEDYDALGDETASNSGKDGDNQAAPGGDDRAKSSSRPSLLRWVSMEDIKMSMDDIKSRIGELPSLRRTRRHWPWDQKHRSRSTSPVQDAQRRRVTTEEDDDKEKGEQDGQQQQQQQRSSSPHESKSEFCIGSIFGLDVGGTLAKLVYFEQKPEECDADEFGRTLHNRERFYRTRASALAVSLARRGLTTIHDHGGDSDSEASSSPSPTSRLRSYSAFDEAMHRSTPHLHPAGTSPPNGSGGHHRKHSSKFGAGGGGGGSPTRLQHSPDSNADLRTLDKMRQESVPDDLNAYAESVHMNGRAFHTTESMEDMLAAQKRHVEHQQRHQQQNGDGMSPSSSSSSLRGLRRSGSSIRKSKSMLDFSRGRIEALDRFYTFAHRLDSYREGVKDHKLSFYSRALGGDFHFIRFETRRMQNAMDLIRANNLHLNIREMGATGGGAHKYAQQWDDELGIEMKKQDELDSLVAGMQFVLSTVVGECYTFRPNNSGTISRSSSLSDYNVGAPIDEESDADADVEENRPSARPSEDRGKGDDWWWSRKVQRDAISYSETYPYMLVTIGTGVSILRVDGPRKHERVSGSTIGGGTYWGLIRLLTDVEDFEDAMRLAERGDASKIDMMVGDIYGENNTVLEKIGLSPDVVASSFGKLVSKEDPASDLKEEDLARALLLMITINIGQISFLNAQQHKASRIYFVGNFLRFNKISQRRLSFSIDYWSKGEMEALFLEHEGYFGALGAFLLENRTRGDTRELKPSLRSQKSMPAPATNDDGSNHSNSTSDRSLRSQKSMPATAGSSSSNEPHPMHFRRSSAG